MQLEECLLHELIHHVHEECDEGLTNYLALCHLARMHPDESAPCITGRIGWFLGGSLAEGGCHVRSLDELTLPWDLPPEAEAVIQGEIDAFYERPDEVRQRYEKVKNGLRLFCRLENYCKEFTALLTDPPSLEHYLL